MSELVYEKYFTYTGVKIFDNGDEFLIECLGIESNGRIIGTDVKLKNIEPDHKSIGLNHAKRVANDCLRKIERKLVDDDMATAAESRGLNFRLSSKSRSLAIEGWSKLRNDQQPIC